MTTSLTMATVRARIFTLPGRPPFMISDDLAEFYQTTPTNLMRQVQRNTGRFPEDFIFEMTEAEFREQLRQNGTTAERKRTDLKHYGFTKEGALQLSSVLTGPVADEVSVTIIRTFADLERQALDQAQAMFAKLQIEEATRRPIRAKMILAARTGMSFEAIWRAGSYSRAQVAAALRECLAMGAIPALPKGMPAIQPDLFSHG